MLRQTLRSALLSSVSRAMFPVAAMCERWVRRIALPLFLPAGVYVPGPRGDKLRAAMPSPPAMPVLWHALPQFWRGIDQRHTI